MARQPDAVTPDYIEAHRLGVFIRTPIENIAFFQAEHKAVVAYTKTAGSFVLDIPLHEIEATLAGKVTMVHRSYLVPTDLLPGLKHWRNGSHWVMEIMTNVRCGDRLGMMGHTIPVSRRLTQKVKALLKEAA